MSTKLRYSAAAIVLSLAGVMTGCHQQKPSSHYEGSNTQGSVAVVPNDIVVLDLPTVRLSGGEIFISGTVHRKPGVQGELPGRVDIEFLGPEGQYLDGLPALLDPRSVPRDPNAVATYSTSYGYIPPSGSTVRVHFVDAETQMQEDLENNGFGYGGGGDKNGGHGGGGSHYAGHGGGTGNHW